jgi:hypothetical protein
VRLRVHARRQVVVAFQSSMALFDRWPHYTLMILYIAIAIVVLIAVFLIWGVVRLRKGNTQATEAIRKVRIEDLAGLVAEGKAGIQRGFGVSIDLTDREAAAKILDSLFADQMKLKGAFEKAGFYWHFALPVGALVGEFMRIHAKGVWTESPEGLLMKIPVKDGVATCFPFDKVLKQVDSGEKGDLYAFLLSSIQLASVDHVA